MQYMCVHDIENIILEKICHISIPPSVKRAEDKWTKLKGRGKEFLAVEWLRIFGRRGGRIMFE